MRFRDCSPLRPGQEAKFSHYGVGLRRGEVSVFAGFNVEYWVPEAWLCPPSGIAPIREESPSSPAVAKAAPMTPDEVDEVERCFAAATQRHRELAMGVDDLGTRNEMLGQALTLSNWRAKIVRKLKDQL